MSEYDKHEHGKPEHDKRKKCLKCPARVCEDISVAVPVEVHAHTDVKDIVLVCKGHRIVKDNDRGRHRSRFTIVQEISLQIPVECVAEVEVRDERVEYELHNCNREA